MTEGEQNGFDELFRRARQREGFWVETAKLDYCEGLRNLMRRQGWSKAELAKQLGVSKAYITKVFQGNANFTLETMVKLAHALGGRVQIQVVEQVQQPDAEASRSDQGAAAA